MRLRNIFGGFRSKGADLVEAYNAAMAATDLEVMIACTQQVLDLCEEYQDWPLDSPSRDFVIGRMYGPQGIAFHDLIEKDPERFAELAIVSLEKSAHHLRAENPTDLAVALLNLGNSYTERVDGSRSQNIEKAVEKLEAALRAAHTGGDVNIITDCQICLASSVRRRLLGSAAQNHSRAMQIAEDAVRTMPHHASTHQRIQLHQLLGDLYRTSPSGDRQTNFDRSTDEFRKAVGLIDRERNPVFWAVTLGNLSNALVDDPNTRTRGDSLEEALRYNTKCLEICESEDVPGFRATALLNRSSILAQRQSGDKRDNRTEAISAIERALEFFTADRYPEQHAKLLTNLSNLRSDNIDGDAPVKPEQAVQAARSAIDLVDKDAAPREWASAALALANALYVNSRGNDADSLEEALKLNVEASRIFTPDEDLEAWFRCSLSLLNVWADRLCGNPAENQEYAIALLEAVKEKVSWKESPAVWRSTRLNLGLSYLHRAQGHTTDNVEYALALAEEALAFTDVNTAKEESFSLFELLGDAYVRRVRGSPLENIRAAATAYEDAGATNAHSKTSAAGRRLGSKARRTMIQRGAIERAHAERRGTAAPGHYQGWREVSTSQYLMDIERIGDNLSPATEPSLWRQWMEEKSDIWLSMDPTDDGSDGTFASLLVRLHEGAIKARQLLSAVLENVNFEREPEIAAYYLEKLGRACGVLQLCGEWRKYRLLDPATDAIPEVAIAAEETDYLSQGIACFSQAIELKEYVGSDVVDLARLRALVGEKLCEAGRWEEAIQVFDLAAAQLDVLVTTIETNSVDLASALHTLGSVSQFGPYASIMLGDWKGALELKEIGHARLAAKAITLDALPLPEDIRESIIRLDREWTDLEHKLASNRTFSRLKPLRRIGEIRAELAGLLADGNTSLSGNPDSIETTLEEALSEGCCLVVPVVGRMGGKVIVCRKVGERVDTRVREAGDAYELDRILNARNHGSLDSTARHPGADIRKLRGSLWPNHVDQLCAGISKALVEPVIDALEELGSEGVDELLFAGIGEIGVLPLQVSDTGEAGSPLLDFFAVRVTPSLTISSTLSKRADWESARCGQATIVCQSDNQELRHLITEANWYRVGSPIA